MTDRPHIVFLCTGNAARSVMATVITRARTQAVTVSGAGTHSIEGLPMSTRTRAALDTIGLRDPEHRSHQLVEADVEGADLIAIFEPMHLKYVRKHHPGAASITASLPRLARDLPRSPGASLPERIAALDLGTADFEPWEEIIDPAGGDLPEFTAALEQIEGLLGDVLPALDASG